MPDKVDFLHGVIFLASFVKEQTYIQVVPDIAGSTLDLAEILDVLDIDEFKDHFHKELVGGQYKGLQLRVP